MFYFFEKGSLKNVVLVLGYCYKSDTEDNKYHKGILIVFCLLVLLVEGTLLCLTTH